MKLVWSNRISSVFNFLFIICLWMPNLLLNPEKLYNQFSLSAVLDGAQQIVVITIVLFIFAFAINLFNLIVNWQNKKITFTSIIILIYMFNGILSNFDIDNYEVLFIILVALFAGIMFIIDFIRNIKDGISKKNLIVYLIVACLSVVSILINNYAKLVVILLAIIFQFIFAKDEKINENNKLMQIIESLSLITFGIILLIMFVMQIILINKIFKVDNETKNLIEEIRGNLNISEEHNEFPLLVSKNNKWGYIDTNGNEIIPCEYDTISSLFPKLDPLVIVGKKDETYDVYGMDGKLLCTREKNLLPFLKGKYLEMMLEQAEFGSDIGEEYYNIPKQEFTNLELMRIIGEILNFLVRVNKTIDIAFDPLYTKTILKADDTYGKVYEYNLSNNCKLHIKKLDENDLCNMKIEKEGQILIEMEDVIIPLNYFEKFTRNYGDGDLVLYRNEYIPFCNLNKGIQGYFSINDMTFEYIDISYELLEILDDKMIVRDYSDINNIKDYIIQLDTKEILLTAREISVYDEGFLLRRDNGKIIFLDRDLRRKTKEFDGIVMIYWDKNIMICANDLDNVDREYYLYDINGTRLTKTSYQKMCAIANYDYEGEEYAFDKVFEAYYLK